MSRWVHSRLARHGAFWAGTVVLSFLVQLPAHIIAGVPLYTVGILFVQLPASLLLVYPLLYGIVPRLLRGQFARGLGLLVVWVPASIAAVNGLRRLYDLGPGPAWFGEAAPAPFRWANYQGLGLAWFVLLATAGAASTIKLLHGWYAQQKLSLALRQRQAQTELQLLKAQLQPPFLFATLGLLHELTRRKSALAPAAVLHLAALLRYLLYESPHEAVPLADEVAMLRDYVALERLRLGPRVEVSLSFSGELAAHRIAPLLLLPFLENAFRHGTGAELDCAWVSIDLVARPAGLTFKIINSQPPAAPDLREGPGLRAVRQRLAHLYGSRHALRITPEPDAFVVALHLATTPPAPARTAQPAPALTHSAHLMPQP